MFSFKNDTWNLFSLNQRKKNQIIFCLILSKVESYSSTNKYLSRCLLTVLICYYNVSWKNKKYPQFNLIKNKVINNKHYKFIPVTLPMIKFHA